MAERRFTLFHLSLTKIREPNFDTLQLSREEWLREALRTSIEIPHKGNRILHWVPKGDVGGAILGILEMQRERLQHEPPEAGGGEVMKEEWQGAHVLVDPTHHQEGQRVAVENDIVGTPSALLDSFLEKINARFEKPYQIDAAPIFDEGNFWVFAEKHGQILKSVTFDFVVPNMWGAESELDKDLENTRDQTGAEHVSVKMYAVGGINVAARVVNDGVNYIKRGAGKVMAKSLFGDSFSSDEKPTQTSMPLIGDRSHGILEQFKSFRNRVLGYEKKIDKVGSDFNINDIDNH